jgi:hypothetical protein
MSERDPQARIAAATAVLENDVGVWDVEMEIHPGPGAAPILLTATATNRMVGGRWLVGDHRADSGFEGHGVYGWDDAKGKYVGSWVDSMQTSIARSEGEWDPATRTMTFVVEVNHDGRIVTYREVTEHRDDGTTVYHNLVPTPDGGEFEMIRATYRRRPET